LTEDKYGPEDELHKIKRKLANARDDIEAVAEDTGATLTHYGRMTKERSHDLWHDIDEHLERTLHRTRAKAEDVPAEDAEDYSRMAAGLHALREDMKRHFSRINEDTPRSHAVGTIDEFHQKVDEHLEWMRRTGREW
jgi:predicted RNA-binding Zn ribbon-like protein